jgi:DNA-binding phage protein
MKTKSLAANLNGKNYSAESSRSTADSFEITSGQAALLREILEWKPIPHDKLIYFREMLRHRLHSVILEAFSQRAVEHGLTQKDFAIRIHRSREQINRWLSSASNLTLDSISDIMVGLAMDFDAFPFTAIEQTLTTKSSHAKSKSDRKSRTANRRF